MRHRGSVVRPGERLDPPVVLDDAGDRQLRRDKTNKALFTLGQKVHELEKGIEYWASQVREVGEEIQEALNQEREDDA